jgi:hypothetical protein
VKKSWRIHLVIVAWCLLSVSTEHWFHNWSLAIAIGGAVPGLIVYSLQRAWHEAWFWITVAILSLLQVPLMIYVQPLIVRFKFPILLPLALGDYLGMAIILQGLALIFSRAYARNQQ